MTSHPYISEKLVNARHAEIQQAMQQSRKQIHTGQQSMFARYTVGKLSSWLGGRDSQLQPGKAYMQGL